MRKRNEKKRHWPDELQILWKTEKRRSVEVKIGEYNTFPLPFRYVSRKQEEKVTKLKNLRRKSEEKEKVKVEEEKMKRSDTDPKGWRFYENTEKRFKGWGRETKRSDIDPMGCRFCEKLKKEDHWRSRLVSTILFFCFLGMFQDKVEELEKKVGKKRQGWRKKVKERNGQNKEKVLKKVAEANYGLTIFCQRTSAIQHFETHFFENRVFLCLRNCLLSLRGWLWGNKNGETGLCVSRGAFFHLWQMHQSPHGHLTGYCPDPLSLRFPKMKNCDSWPSLEESQPWWWSQWYRQSESMFPFLEK